MDSRLRNDAVDEGLYSEVEGGVIESGVAEILEPVFGVRDLRAPREMMAARWGADFERDSNLEGAVLDEDDGRELSRTCSSAAGNRIGRGRLTTWAP